MIAPAAASVSLDVTMAADVRRGLTSCPKSLPPYLLYDTFGSNLYERITELPEYYLTRAEREILRVAASDIVLRARGTAARPLGVIELGAGSASKTEILLRAILERQPSCEYVPIDVSPAAIRERRGPPRRLASSRTRATSRDDPRPGHPSTSQRPWPAARLVHRQLRRQLRGRGSRSAVPRHR